MPLFHLPVFWFGYFDGFKTLSRILLRMQAEQNRSVPLWNGFSTNAAEERIGAIMKARRSTMLSITVASVIVAGISVLFATSSNQMLRSTVHSETYSIVTANSAVYSVDHGKTWISEEEYNSLYLKQDITWWTYTEYKDYLEEQIPRWQNLVGKAKYNDHLEKIGIYTQEEIDQTIAIYKENLEAIKHGAKLSRSIESEGHPDTAVALFIHPSEPSIAYSASAIDQSGKIIDLGTFLTKEEQMKALQKLD